ncbi:hypothetical protein FD13_GL001868 [Levilactobacillus senmaizukei DSM 21775 = NBRC 103853]|uniref:Cell surface protein n=1 Tax=Levilactobacillus senmaizukei DSM 21775 = NBRC 103853 TaxID=1423803 RepID=A0A0R2DEH6_9LACO|nr:LPXTG cell wall anchor domain-containing protein [Levilactobacillus senmaizukei]KRN02415.1 hypothetical protein FD13_GL001868 [Levilactobacillus senmaizukei DSM 21775 = NBRC 103853]
MKWQQLVTTGGVVAGLLLALGSTTVQADAVTFPLTVSFYTEGRDDDGVKRQHPFEVVTRQFVENEVITHPRLAAAKLVTSRRLAHADLTAPLRVVYSGSTVSTVQLTYATAAGELISGGKPRVNLTVGGRAHAVAPAGYQLVNPGEGERTVLQTHEEWRVLVQRTGAAGVTPQPIPGGSSSTSQLPAPQPIPKPITPTMPVPVEPLPNVKPEHPGLPVMPPVVSQPVPVEPNTKPQMPTQNTHLLSHSVENNSGASGSLSNHSITPVDIADKPMSGEDPMPIKNDHDRPSPELSMANSAVDGNKTKRRIRRRQRHPGTPPSRLPQTNEESSLWWTWSGLILMSLLVGRVYRRMIA